MIDWADIIFVMERKHQQRLKMLFPVAVDLKSIVVLDIEDNYLYKDPELINILKTVLVDYL